MDVTFRFLGPEEGGVLTKAIEAAYGTTYDVRWVYDPAEVCARLAEGRYVSCVAETPTGELLCHEGMALAAAGGAGAPSCPAGRFGAGRGEGAGGGGRRGRPLRPGRDLGGGARPASLHPHQAGADGLGTRARPRRDV